MLTCWNGGQTGGLDGPDIDIGSGRATQMGAFYSLGRSVKMLPETESLPKLQTKLSQINGAGPLGGPLEHTSVPQPLVVLLIQESCTTRTESAGKKKEIRLKS